MIKTNKFRDLATKDFLIKEVYNPYFAGWTDDGTTKKKRVFKKFPIFPDDVLMNWTEAMDEVKKLPMDKIELREQVWDKDNKRFTFTKLKTKVDRDFFKTYKKVFDVIVEFENEISVNEWNSELKKEVPVFTNEVQLVEVPASRIKAMLEVLQDEQPEMMDWKDRTGNPAKVPVYDYEDKMKELLKGKFCKFKVSWTWMDTKYTFLPWKEFKTLDDVFEAPKSKVKEEEIRIEDIPF